MDKIEYTPRLERVSVATNGKCNAPAPERIKKVRIEIIPMINAVFFCCFSS
jgi:hypothetical protein